MVTSGITGADDVSHAGKSFTRGKGNGNGLNTISVIVIFPDCVFVVLITFLVVTLESLVEWV